MSGWLVVLTGASGCGKTAIACSVQDAHPDLCVFQFDTIGVPSNEVIATFGSGYQPGGAWQRAMTLQWFERIVPILNSGESVLFEGQMRIAFILEAIAVHKIEEARLILVDCDDATRASRLIHDRHQPELANETMMAWAAYLRGEAVNAGCEVLDTRDLTLAESIKRISAYLT